MMLVGHNNKLMEPKLLQILPLLPIEIEILLKIPLHTENGSKVKSLIPTLILNGSVTDLNKLTEPLNNFLLPDVKLTNFSSNNLKNTMMPLKLLPF